MYNRQTLLDLRLVASDLTNTTYTGHKTLPPFLCGIPANLCRTLAPASRRKRFRRRGKRSGLLVKLKAYLVRSSPAPWNKRGSVPHHVFSPGSLEPIDAWLVPVVASDQMSQPRKIFPHLRRRGANLRNLRPLCRVSQSATNTLTSTRISMEDPDDSCPEEIPGVKEALKNNDTAGAAKRIKEYLEKQTNVSLNIAITGESGAGKSTFINAFRGIKNRDEGAAPTGVTETTSEVTPYPHPDNPNLTLWDLPGIGTKDFPARKYLKLVGFDKYDFFLIISDTRFRENDVKLAQKIKKMKRNFYFVRSKIDNDIRAEESVSDSSKEKTLTKIRDDCIQRLKDLGIESPRVFLMSSFQLHKFDFSLLQETLERELPKDKRDTLLYVMPNVNPDVISKKKKALKVHLYLLATLSAAAAAVPVPGLSVAVDVAVLIGAVTHFVHAFGLDVQSLKRLAIRTAVSYTELRDVIISPVAAKEITKELFLKAFAQLGGAAGLIGAEEVSRFIPIVGIPVAMSLSFVTTYRVLNFILNQLAEDAQKVLKKALV
ncbi:unnamed protein product [Oreochromis niloticus]|nr:unnamed protein product [Mustela putorius furo]